jgi:ankyrin repeat protein
VPEWRSLLTPARVGYHLDQADDQPDESTPTPRSGDCIMDEKTFFQEASRGDQLRARSALETNGQLAASRNEAGVSVIAATADAGRLDFAKEIARRRTDLDLFEAACIGDGRRVRALVSADPAAIDRHAPDGFTAVGIAARFGHVELLQRLIQAGADVEAISANALKARPLHVASAHVNSERASAVARPLLVAGADPNSQRRGGHTALHESVYRPNLALARLLLAYGASPHVSNDDGDSALQIACAAGRRDLVAVFEQTLHAAARPAYPS